MVFSMFQDLIESLSDVKEFNKNPNGCGFAAKFHNGYTVSVQWGPGTYSKNGMLAEIAVWDANGDWEDLGGGDFGILGWQTANEAFDLIKKYKDKK